MEPDLGELISELWRAGQMMDKGQVNGARPLGQRSLREVRQEHLAKKAQEATQPPEKAATASVPLPPQKAQPKQQQAKKKKKPRREQPDPGRLPHGAIFHVEYDGTKQEWSGTLTIPGYEPFSGTASGLFRLERNLDGMFRAAEKSRQAETSAAVVIEEKTDSVESSCRS